MLYLGLTKYVCFNHRLKCFLFFTYFKKRYKVTKLWLKITICSHPKCTKLDFFQKRHQNATPKSPKSQQYRRYQNVSKSTIKKENGRDVIHHVRL